MSNQTWSSRSSVRNGLLVAVFCLGGSILWALTAELHGAVTAAGVVEVVSRGQSIQHPDGGIVQDILARNGDLVEAGQAVLVLNSSDLHEQRAAVARQLFETRMNMDRLLSQAENLAALRLRQELVDQARMDLDLAARLQEERHHFEAWRALNSGREAQLSDRISALEAILDGLFRQRDALSEAHAFAGRRLEERRRLLSRGLERATTVAQLERDQMDLNAQIAALDARIAETQGAVTERVGENHRTLDANREQALAEFRAQASTEGELRSRLRLIDSRLERQVLRTPVRGVIHDLRVFTKGGVVSSGQTLMTIVPDDLPLIFSVRVSPTDIEHVRRGQPTRIQFPGVSSNDMQPLKAMVQTVSPDVVVDPTSGLSHYAVELILDVDPQGAVDALNLVPGMPVQASIETGSRSVARYLLSPITDFFRSGLTEI